MVAQRNWKQCTWKKLNDERDYGLIKVNNSTFPDVMTSLVDTEYEADGV